MSEQRRKNGEDNDRLCASRSEEEHTNLTIDVLSWPHGDYTSRLEKHPEGHADAGEVAAWQHRLLPVLLFMTDSLYSSLYFSHIRSATQLAPLNKVIHLDEISNIALRIKF